MFPVYNSRVAKAMGVKFLAKGNNSRRRPCLGIELSYLHISCGDSGICHPIARQWGLEVNPHLCHVFICLVWPDPFCAAAYQLEIISVALQGSGIVYDHQIFDTLLVMKGKSKTNVSLNLTLFGT